MDRARVLGCAAALSLAACAHQDHHIVAAGAGQYAGTYICTYHSAHRLPHVAASGTLTIAADGSYVRTSPGGKGESRGWISSIHQFDGAHGPDLEFTSGTLRYRMQSLDNGTRLHITWKSMTALDCVKRRSAAGASSES